MKIDILIIGAGIVGLSTAYQLRLLNPHLNIALLEKECKAALHQTGRNSGVIHSGIYYKPKSLKAQNCILGKQELFQFCEKKHIPTKQVGKIIVATSNEELKLLHTLYLQGIENKIDISLIDPEQIKEIEPYICAMKAIWVPKCAIVNFSQVANEIQKDLQEKDVELFFQQKVLSIKQKKGCILVETDKRNFTSKYVVNCAGLYSDALVGEDVKQNFQIIPFKGEYFHLTPQKRDLIRGLVYPVKNPKLPFLGVHLTKMINGEVHAGPNAVLALAKEGYGKRDVNAREILQMITYRGFWKMAIKHWKIAAYEMYRSMSKQAFVKDLQKFFPHVEVKDLIPAQSGIRAQVVLRDGTLFDDFLFKTEGNILHVINSPSPAATASFSIGRHIANNGPWNALI